MPSREPDLYKDKVEVSLDGRQIFYLFFGGAVIVGVVFVLGVLVGRRVEARGHIDRARTAASADPLAALDRLEGGSGLTFRGALTGKEATSDVEKKIGALGEGAASGKADKADKAAKVSEEPKADKAEPKADKAEPKAEPKADKAEPKAEPKADKAAKADDKKKSDDKKADEGEARRYTLQLSSFQERSEAEAFLDKIKAQGFSAHITQAEVEGKGTFYRVRMGSYKSVEAANEAKAEFERDAKKSASVMKL